MLLSGFRNVVICVPQCCYLITANPVFMRVCGNRKQVLKQDLKQVLKQANKQGK